MGPVFLLLENVFSLQLLQSNLFFTYYFEADVFRAWERGRYHHRKMVK